MVDDDAWARDGEGGAVYLGRPREEPGCPVCNDRGCPDCDRSAQAAGTVLTAGQRAIEDFDAAVARGEATPGDAPF